MFAGAADQISSMKSAQPMGGRERAANVLKMGRMTNHDCILHAGYGLDPSFGWDLFYILTLVQVAAMRTWSGLALCNTDLLQWQWNVRDAQAGHANVITCLVCKPTLIAVLSSIGVRRGIPIKCD